MYDIIANSNRCSVSQRFYGNKQYCEIVVVQEQNGTIEKFLLNWGSKKLPNQSFAASNKCS
jgi:hypothetical protein